MTTPEQNPSSSKIAKVDEVANNIKELRKMMEGIYSLFQEVDGFRRDTEKAIVLDPRINELEKNVTTIVDFIRRFTDKYNENVNVSFGEENKGTFQQEHIKL